MNSSELCYPLSSSQQGMLFHSLYENQQGYYIQQVVGRLKESLQTSLFLQSWRNILNRHSILRTSFRQNEASQFCQYVHQNIDFSIVEQDWQFLSESIQEKKLQEYLDLDRQTDIDIGKAPLMRLAIFKFTPKYFTFVWTFHHILLDGRSTVTVLQEVFSLYDSYNLNQSSSLPECHSYEKYVDWLEKQSWDTSEQFWREKMQGFARPTKLPTLPQDVWGSSTSHHDFQKIQLSSDLTIALQNLAEEYQLTLNTLIQAAWALIISQHSGNSDVVFGTVRACRYSSLSSLKSMVGLFINTLPICIRVSSQTTLLAWLKSIRTQWIALREHENTPLVKVQEWSDIPAGTSLFDSLLIFDYLEFDAAVKAEGNQWQWREFQLLEKTHYPLVLKATGGKNLTLAIHFDHTQFAEVTIEQILRELETVLQGFVAYSQALVADLLTFYSSCTQDYGGQKGSVSPVLDWVARGDSKECNAANYHPEEVLAEHLQRLAPFHHPYLLLNLTKEDFCSTIHRYPISANTSPTDSIHWIAIFVAYCARLSAELEFDLGLQVAARQSVLPVGLDQPVPWRIQAQAENSFYQFKENLERDLYQMSCRGSLRQYPEFHGSAQNTVLPVTIVLATSPDYWDGRHLETTLAFVAYEDGSLPEVIHTGILNEAYSQAIVEQLQCLRLVCLQYPETPLNQLPLLSDQGGQKTFEGWNQTTHSVPSNICIHELFEQQVERFPEAIALIFQDQRLTYRQLNSQANQLAHYLQEHGVGPDVVVGIHMERSPDMMVGLLAIHKAGGAYLPLDPDFPQDRLAFMVQNSQTPILLTQQHLVLDLAIEADIRIIAIDSLQGTIAQKATTNPESRVNPSNLCYVIYTSGSTGEPKGVMVEHRNVVNFFAGMDNVIDHDPQGVWLAITSLSFDISVLELFWTLTRGFKVVVYDPKADWKLSVPDKVRYTKRIIDFSLFYFSSHEQNEDVAEKYRLLIEGTRFGDAHGFKAVWTPERHFHAFGGLFPNPAVTSAALAAITSQIQIRAGSCVSPLHSSIRIAEDWSVVDNLSQGRVGISFAPGWQPNDFGLKPEAFSNRKAIMLQQIEEVQALWRGESVTCSNGKGELIQVHTLPRPVQAKLPTWITAAGNPDTFREAGAKGLNILTHLLGQSLEELAHKISIYRQAWIDNEHPGQGTVTLVLHTFVGETVETVKEIVRQPMREYLASSLELIKQAAWSFPALKAKLTDESGGFSISHLSKEDKDEILDFSFERYFQNSGLFGSVETCLQTVERIKSIGVDEIACLIDYGVETETVLAQLPLLKQVKEKANFQPQLESSLRPSSGSIADLIKYYQVTHLQCTPSMARMLLTDTETRETLHQITAMLVGGEALTEALGAQLQQVIGGKVFNMYGPTETTIWSTVHFLDEVNGPVPIGRPIANTELYILDKNCQPVPVGVAGELFIGGMGVTRGYLNRPDLTEERFVPNLFSANSGDRLYRTGDLARYNLNGQLEFLGRIDFQVKVRGYRIELGEIETLLSRHEAVREVVVVVREDTPGDKRLVAYLLPEQGKQVLQTDLYNYLRNQLPEYMVPSLFISLETFPLTPNKKIDRKALPPPPRRAFSAEPTQTLSLSPLEQKMVGIWQKILKESDIGLHDDFFDLGGNSLIAMNLIEVIRSTFEIDFPLIDLFQYPTVAQLTKRLAERLL